MSRFRFSSEAELRAAVSLLEDDRFKVVLGAVANYGEQAVKELIYQREGVAQLQGRSQMVTELLESFATCREQLAKRDKPQE